MGSPAFRQRGGSDFLPKAGWGVQPSGPLLAIRNSVPASGPAGVLPSKEALDYVHSLTQTTLLLIGVVVFALLYRRNPSRAARKLVGRVT